MKVLLCFVEDYQKVLKELMDVVSKVFVFFDEVYLFCY